MIKEQESISTILRLYIAWPSLNFQTRVYHDDETSLIRTQRGGVWGLAPMKEVEGYLCL
jgi:hypothetical protein